ncbi:hypothetical protein BOTBODRAFT_179032 [Botryobasidium botryosum FD-172 SS1]|uniref:Protein kinase domain-containing protein n=1 Tax=Botryobasidium botryosum (strain FD-172 SS1) TaxID=930990 RepID=A0A067M1R3_BOTB1|nr:hypothetical protein BOTBODRAFT_179032 [Botryobasidium botryosum FD-172 SS1]
MHGFAVDGERRCSVICEAEPLSGPPARKQPIGYVTSIPRSKKPVIRGGLKAANIFISGTGVAPIVNFGLSEYAKEEKPPRCSTEWYCARNPRWQAPELLSAPSKEEALRTIETDSFAYGRVMLEVFPFFYLSDSTLSIFQMVRHGQFPERPLDKDPKQRPGVAEIFDHLEAVRAPRGRPDDEIDSKDSNPRPEKRARATELPVKVEEVDI